MRMMDISIEEDDCTIETVTPAKQRKMKQARLSFHTPSASKSPNSTNNVPNKKKRKIISPLEECKNPKVTKYATKENSIKNVSKGKGENSEEEVSDDDKCIEIISDEEEQNNQQNHERNKQIDTTPKRHVLEKNKKLDKSQDKPGTLTKFLKKADKAAVKDVNDDLFESQDQQNYQNTPKINKGKSEICNESSNAQSVESTSQCVSHVNEKSQGTNVANKDAEDHSPCLESDSDVAILSSDNEALSDLDKSITNESEQKTSKLSATPTDKDAKKKLKKLTQKQLEKRQEIAKRKEEKAKLKMEREKKREEEKANRRREREEKQREKEEKEKIEKEQKKKEKELKELKKQMEIEQKQKEKEAKEEERRKREEAKEEEKRRKEEERLEAERKKQKAASNFASFFVSKKQDVKSTEEESDIEAKNFMPFEIKADMRIAPVCRRTLDENEKLLLDEKCKVNVKRSGLYLEDIKRRRIVPRISSKTWPLEAKDDDIILLDEDNDNSANIIRETHHLERHRPKLLQFNDNRRPPYWGTWRKRSNIVNSRRPFAKDQKCFDYEVDSDDEWEEEEPGESLKGSDDEKDEENPEENEYDVDNEFMVPHGYLSDEEARADEEEMKDMSPQTQKMKLKLLGEQFEAERNAKTHKLKPRIIGCIWQGLGNSFPESVLPKVEEFLSARRAWVSHIPIILPSSLSPENDSAISAECKTSAQQQSRRSTKKTKRFPDEALPDLIRLVHGNTYSRRFLMKEFMTFWNRNDKAGGYQLSKTGVLQKINELANKIACPEEGPMHLKSCWYVPEDTRKRYLPGDDLTLPNRWAYILTPNRKSDVQDAAEKAEKEEKERGETEKEKEKRHVPLITQFTKKITQEEMKRQLTAKPDQALAVTSKQPPLQRPPKRATLISVGRGEQFPEKSRKNMLAKFIGINTKKEESSSSEKKIIDDSDDVIIVESVDKDEKTDGNLESTDKMIKTKNHHGEARDNEKSEEKELL